MVKLFVANLSSKTTQDSLQRLFEQQGKVNECVIVSTYGFVHYENETDATNAIQRLNGYELDGSRIKIERSTGGSKGRDGDKGGKGMPKRNEGPGFGRRGPGGKRNSPSPGRGRERSPIGYGRPGYDRPPFPPYGYPPAPYADYPPRRDPYYGGGYDVSGGPPRYAPPPPMDARRSGGYPDPYDYSRYPGAGAPAPVAGAPFSREDAAARPPYDYYSADPSYGRRTSPEPAAYAAPTAAPAYGAVRRDVPPVAYGTTPAAPAGDYDRTARGPEYDYSYGPGAPVGGYAR